MNVHGGIGGGGWALIIFLVLFCWPVALILVLVWHKTKCDNCGHEWSASHNTEAIGQQKAYAANQYYGQYQQPAQGYQDPVYYQEQQQPPYY